MTHIEKPSTRNILTTIFGSERDKFGANTLGESGHKVDLAQLSLALRLLYSSRKREEGRKNQIWKQQQTSLLNQDLNLSSLSPSLCPARKSVSDGLFCSEP